VNRLSLTNSFHIGTKYHGVRGTELLDQIEYVEFWKQIKTEPKKTTEQGNRTDTGSGTQTQWEDFLLKRVNSIPKRTSYM